MGCFVIDQSVFPNTSGVQTALKLVYFLAKTYTTAPQLQIVLFQYLKFGHLYNTRIAYTNNPSCANIFN